MSGPFKRRPSLKALPNVGLVKAANIQRRQSAVNLKPVSISQQEVPWDVLDRCLLPVVFCHAAAIVISTMLNTLHISQVSTLTLFIFFAITTIAAVLFYHNLKVNRGPAINPNSYIASLPKINVKRELINNVRGLF